MAPFILVLIIDTGILPGNPYVRNPTSEPSNVHGTQVAHVLSDGGLCPQVKIDSCDFIKESVARCLQKAKGYDFINLSFAGRYSWVLEEFYIKQLSNSGTVFTVAAGNDRSKDLAIDKIYPASYFYEGMTTNFHVVTDKDYPLGNRGEGLKQEPATWYVPDGKGGMLWNSGTSYSAPSFLRKMLLKLCAEYNNKDNGLTCEQ